jgi:hypothetical protein
MLLPKVPVLVSKPPPMVRGASRTAGHHAPGCCEHESSSRARAAVRPVSDNTGDERRADVLTALLGQPSWHAGAGERALGRQRDVLLSVRWDDRLSRNAIARTDTGRPNPSRGIWDVATTRSRRQQSRRLEVG